MTIGHPTEDEFTLILPTLNEVDNIGPMIDTLSKLYPSAHIIIVDDSSTDGTTKVAMDHADNSGKVEVIVRNPVDRGLTSSIMDGIMNTKTRFFVVLDSDFQHPPTSIKDIMTSFMDGNDLVIGVREDKENLPFLRELASDGAQGIAKLYLTVKGQPKTRDTMSGFFGGRTELVQKVIRENSERFEGKGFKALFDILKFAPKDIKIGEILFKFNPRRGGESKLNSRIVISILRQCGIVGRGLATTSTFLLMTPWGRLMAATLLGLNYRTFVLITMTGGNAWTGTFTFYTLLSLVLAIVLMVMTSELSKIPGGKHVERNGPGHRGIQCICDEPVHIL